MWPLYAPGIRPCSCLDLMRPLPSPPLGPRDHLFREDCWEPSSTGPLPGLTGGTQNFLEGWKCVVWVRTLARARPRDRGGVVQIRSVPRVITPDLKNVVTASKTPAYCDCSILLSLFLMAHVIVCHHLFLCVSLCVACFLTHTCTLAHTAQPRGQQPSTEVQPRVSE